MLLRKPPDIHLEHVFFHGFYLTEYKKTELEARQSGCGMWTQGDDYISPRDWRKMQKR